MRSDETWRAYVFDEAAAFGDLFRDGSMRPLQMAGDRLAHGKQREETLKLLASHAPEIPPANVADALQSQVRQALANARDEQQRKLFQTAQRSWEAYRSAEGALFFRRFRQPSRRPTSLPTSKLVWRKREPRSSPGTRISAEPVSPKVGYNPLMDYVGSIYRPPSEADSLLLQVTVGCSHNACTYCAMYLEKRFRAKPWEVIDRDIREAAQIGPRFHRVFLCDGDALVLSTDRLRTILRAVRDRLGWVQRVSVYGDTRSVLRKSVEELTELRELGLGMVYHGVESGDDDVLRFVSKGGTRAEVVQTAQRLRAAGIAHSVIVMLGIGGVEGAQKHACETASLLSEIDPPYVGVLTTTLVPGTPLYEAGRAGTFTLPTKFEMLRELLTIVENAELSNCRFSSNHASNYLPVRCTMPRDKDRVVGVLREVVDAGDESMLRPEWTRGL